MRSDCRSFEEFWSAFAGEQTSFRLGRAGVSLVMLALRQHRPERWRWAMAAAVLTAGKLIAGTLGEELDARRSRGGWPDEAHPLATGELAARPSSDGAPRADTAWAAWM